MTGRIYDVYLRPYDRGEQRRYAIAFAAAFGLLLGFALWANSRLVDLRGEPIDFGALGPSELIVEQGLTRAQAGGLKIGYLERFPPPRIGLFGNHQVQYFGADALPARPSPGLFFNAWYANLSLTELLDLLRYLEAEGKLPTETILVQATTPNNDNGRYILGYSGELPPDLVGYGGATDSASLLVRADHWRNAVEQALHRVFNYSTVIFGLAGTAHQDRVVDIAGCNATAQAEPQGFGERLLAALPATVRQQVGAVGGAGAYCDPVLWGQAFRADGSHDGRFIRAHPNRDENPLDPSDTRLRPEHEAELVATLKDLAAIGTRNGLRVILVIPPVYESARHSTVNKVFSDALAEVPELEVIDHRGAFGEARYFINYDHPGPAYFAALGEELDRRGVLPAGPAGTTE